MESFGRGFRRSWTSGLNGRTSGQRQPLGYQRRLLRAARQLVSRLLRSQRQLHSTLLGQPSVPIQLNPHVHMAPLKVKKYQYYGRIYKLIIEIIAPVRQHGPVATPPMAHRPGNTQHRNEIEMRQHQPVSQPAMQYSAPNAHQHITHIHAPPNPQPQPTPPPNVYNDISYYSYCERFILHSSLSY